MNFRRIAFALATVLFAPTIALADCKTAEEMLDFPKSALNGVEPCDRLGTIFLRYNEISSRARFSIGTLAQADYIYYVLFKSSVLSEPSVMGKGGILMSALAVLPENDTVRSAAYKFAILREYARLSPDEAATLSNHVNALAFALKSSFENSGFENVAALDCFVDADIPNLSVETVLGSKFFEDCVTQHH